MKRTLLSLLLLTIIGCTDFDHSSRKATLTLPESAQVEQPGAPLDPSAPRYLVAVEPLLIPRSISETQWDTRSDSSGSSSATTDSSHQSTTTLSGKATVAGTTARSNTPSNTTPPPASNNSLAVKENNGLVPVQAVNSATAGGATPAAAASGPATVSGAVTNKDSSHVDSKATRDAQGNTSRVVTSRVYLNPRDSMRIAAQLVSALSGFGNLAPLDIATLKRTGDGTYSPRTAVGADERGPFVVRALITEYTATAEEDSSKIQVPGIYKSSERITKGVVGLDITLLEAATGRIVAAFPAHGSFSSQENKVGAGLIMPVVENRSFAQSVLDQALRVALNDAAQRIDSALRTAIH